MVLSMSKTSRGQHSIWNGGTLPHVKGRSRNLTISLSFMFLCIFHSLLTLYPADVLQF